MFPGGKILNPLQNTEACFEAFYSFKNLVKWDKPVYKCILKEKRIKRQNGWSE